MNCIHTKKFIDLSRYCNDFFAMFDERKASTRSPYNIVIAVVNQRSIDILLVCFPGIPELTSDWIVIGGHPQSLQNQDVLVWYIITVRWTMYILLSMLSALFSGCESVDKEQQDTGTEVEETFVCTSAVYPALLQVWSSSEESNLVDTPPFCEAPFEIELLDGGEIHSVGDCQFEGGQQTRTLSYEFLGQLNESGHYSGEVSLTKRNGEQDLADFSGMCTETDLGVEVSIEWSMTVTTPYGEIEHNGSVATDN